MKNTARQSNALVSMPPKSTPAAMPMLATVPQTARAVARCRPAYVVMTIDMRGRGEHRGAGALGAAGQDQR